MYKSFEIRNFRCFKQLNISKLQRINLIAGLNNSGKTALLEALVLHIGATNPALAITVNAFRGITQMKLEPGNIGDFPWRTLFREMDFSSEVTLIGHDTVTGSRTLHLRILQNPSEVEENISPQTFSAGTANVASSQLPTGALELEDVRKDGSRSYRLLVEPSGIRSVPVPPPPPFPGHFLATRLRLSPEEDATRFSNLAKIKKQGMVLEALQLIEPRLRKLEVLVAFGESMIHGDIGFDELVPLPVMGDGMVRLASMVLAIAASPQGVVLIDEFENGLHYSVLQKAWAAIAKAARSFDTQVFATTHSWECIVAAHKAFQERKPYDFALYRLDRRDNEINAVSYDEEALEASIQSELEVR